MHVPVPSCTCVYMQCGSTASVDELLHTLYLVLSHNKYNYALNSSTIVIGNITMFIIKGKLITASYIVVHDTRNSMQILQYTPMLIAKEECIIIMCSVTHDPQFYIVGDTGSLITHHSV